MYGTIRLSSNKRKSNKQGNPAGEGMDDWKSIQIKYLPFEKKGQGRGNHCCNSNEIMFKTHTLGKMLFNSVLIEKKRLCYCK